jgi:hypothetical protein
MDFGGAFEGRASVRGTFHEVQFVPKFTPHLLAPISQTPSLKGIRED